jgi:hypothetical protein
LPIGIAITLLLIQVLPQMVVLAIGVLLFAGGFVVMLLIKRKRRDTTVNRQDK